MTTSALKNKVIKSIEEMDAEHLELAYKIFKEFSCQSKYINKDTGNDLVKKK